MGVARSHGSRAVGAVRRRARRVSRVSRPSRHRSTRPTCTLTAGVSPRTVDRAVAVVDGLPPARTHLVAAAAARLAAGERPSSYAIADMALRGGGFDVPA